MDGLDWLLNTRASWLLWVAAALIVCGLLWELWDWWRQKKPAGVVFRGEPLPEAAPVPEVMPVRIPAEMELAMKKLSWSTRKEADPGGEGEMVVLYNFRNMPLMRFVVREGRVVSLTASGKVRRQVPPEVERAMPLFASQSPAWQKRVLEMWLEKA